MTSPRASAFVMLSRQLIDLTGPFEGLETLPDWRFVDFLIAREGYKKVIEAAEENLILWIDSREQQTSQGAPAMRQMYLDYHKEYNRLEIAWSGQPPAYSPVPFDQENAMRLALQAHSGLLAGHKKKSFAQNMEFRFKHDADTDDYVLRFRTLKRFPNELTTQVYIPGFAMVYWNLSNFCGTNGPMGCIVVYEHERRPKVVRTTLLYARAVFEAFRPILDLPGIEGD
jgi:hypothetical protein